jgi:transposase
MDLRYPKCAGLDVHQQTVVACARVVAGSSVTHDRRTFGTTTGELLALSDWLTAHGCTHVAMESTGVYWKPIWQVLEGSFTLVLANAMHIRNIPGRKSDMNDATWIADLLAHGLIRGSFVPPAPVQELRDLTRTRKQLVREITQHTLRIQKTLENANLKLTGLLSNILGVSGRAILQALVAGETNPERLADLVHGRLKASRVDLVAALHGRVTARVTMRSVLQTQRDSRRGSCPAARSVMDPMLPALHRGRQAHYMQIHPNTCIHILFTPSW